MPRTVLPALLLALAVVGCAGEAGGGAPVLPVPAAAPGARPTVSAPTAGGVGAGVSAGSLEIRPEVVAPVGLAPAVARTAPQAEVTGQARVDQSTRVSTSDPVLAAVNAVERVLLGVLVLIGLAMCARALRRIDRNFGVLVAKLDARPCLAEPSPPPTPAVPALRFRAAPADVAPLGRVAVALAATVALFSAGCGGTVLTYSRGADGSSSLAVGQGGAVTDGTLRGFEFDEAAGRVRIRLREAGTRVNEASVSRAADVAETALWGKTIRDALGAVVEGLRVVAPPVE